MTPDDLIAFEAEIAELFNAGRIPYPVHLSDGNEEQLIEIFKTIARTDWVLGSWRMHYHALLHGVPPKKLKAAIMEGYSMGLNFPEYRVLGSAIVGGTLPIALGVAFAVKRNGDKAKVWCFLGDMTFRSGIAYECITYAANFELPITWVVEDNGVSVCTDTREVWGIGRKRGPEGPTQVFNRGNVRYYQYQSKYPHAGAGVRVQF